MRFVMHVSLPVEKFNDALRAGTAGQTLGRILEEIKPEAAYFTAADGQRGGFLIVNMESTSEMVRLAEPFFLNFDAKVQFLPCMTPQDLQNSGLDAIAAKWK